MMPRALSKRREETGLHQAAVIDNQADSPWQAGYGVFAMASRGGADVVEASRPIEALAYYIAHHRAPSRCF